VCPRCCILVTQKEIGVEFIGPDGRALGLDAEPGHWVIGTSAEHSRRGVRSHRPKYITRHHSVGHIIGSTGCWRPSLAERGVLVERLECCQLEIPLAVSSIFSELLTTIPRVSDFRMPYFEESRQYRNSLTGWKLVVACGVATGREIDRERELLTNIRLTAPPLFSVFSYILYT
jgi:hypothetical protein